MLRLTIASIALIAAGSMTMAAADSVIGQGVQGRPHGGHTPQRMLYFRHGLNVPYRYRHHRHSRYNY